MEAGARGIERVVALTDQAYIGERDLHAVADADGEDQERDQNGNRIQAVAEGRDDAHLPDHGGDRAGERGDGEVRRARNEVEQHGGDGERYAEEQHDGLGAVGDVAYGLGEAEDAYLGVRVVELGAEFLIEEVGEFRVV